MVSLGEFKECKEVKRDREIKTCYQKIDERTGGKNIEDMTLCCFPGREIIKNCYFSGELISLSSDNQPACLPASLPTSLPACRSTYLLQTCSKPDYERSSKWMNPNLHHFLSIATCSYQQTLAHGQGCRMPSLWVA